MSAPPNPSNSNPTHTLIHATHFTSSLLHTKHPKSQQLSHVSAKSTSPCSLTSKLRPKNKYKPLNPNPFLTHITPNRTKAPIKPQLQPPRSKHTMTQYFPQQKFPQSNTTTHTHHKIKNRKLNPKKWHRSK